MNWPKKPAGLTEHEWVREIEKRIKLTVISADAAESICKHCGERRTIFQCQVYPEREIQARCKDCAIGRAGGEPYLWVRTDAYLRQKWRRDGKDPIRAARMRTRHSRRPDGGTAAVATPKRLLSPAGPKSPQEGY